MEVTASHFQERRPISLSGPSAAHQISALRPQGGPADNGPMSSGESGETIWTPIYGVFPDCDKQTRCCPRRQVSAVVKGIQRLTSVEANLKRRRCLPGGFVHIYFTTTPPLTRTREASTPGCISAASSTSITDHGAHINRVTLR